MITVIKKFSVELPPSRNILLYAKKLGFLDELQREDTFVVVRKRYQLNHIMELPANELADDYPFRVLEVLEEFAGMTDKDTLDVWSEVMDIEGFDGNA
jgi:hypothetical protein